MSRRADGKWRCDGKCSPETGGVELPNEGVRTAVMISDFIETEEGLVPRMLQLCRDRPDPGDPEKTIQGCRDRVLTRKALRNYYEEGGR